MSDKLTIPFLGLTEAEVNSTGVFTSISFDTLRKLLRREVILDDDESISGLVISSEGVKVRIDKH